jgi:hypothetical protein
MIHFYLPDVPHPRQIVYATALVVSFHLIQTPLPCPEYQLCPAVTSHGHLDDKDDPREPARPEVPVVTLYHVTGSIGQP